MVYKFDLFLNVCGNRFGFTFSRAKQTKKQRKMVRLESGPAFNVIHISLLSFAEAAGGNLPKGANQAGRLLFAQFID